MASTEGAWRVVVRIGAREPELQVALAALPARARAERLRQLALVGWHCLRSGSAPTRAPEMRASDDALSARRSRLMRTLINDGE